MNAARGCFAFLTWLGLLLAAPLAAAGPPAAEQSRLGERLFFDRALSADGRVSCATCHRPQHFFSDGLPLARGLGRRQGTRNTPSLLDVKDQRSLFWEGRRDSLEAQALDPFLNPDEHGLASEAELLSRIRRVPAYRAAFNEAYGIHPEQIQGRHVASALAAFQRTLVSGPAPVDRFLAGDTSALSMQAQRGWVLFSSTAQCVRCHAAALGETRPLFTDHAFHALGVGHSQVERKLPALSQMLSQARKDGRPLDHAVLRDPDVAQLGRFAFTLDPRDLGKFKTPSLRNVAHTAPYMHDGSVATLAQAVDLELYYRGGKDGRPLILTPDERADLLAFLEALSSDARPAGFGRGQRHGRNLPPGASPWIPSPEKGRGGEGVGSLPQAAGR